MYYRKYKSTKKDIGSYPMKLAPLDRVKSRKPYFFLSKYQIERKYIYIPEFG